jgi:hypothetical protein
MSGPPVPGGGRAGLLTADARDPRLPPGYRCQVELIQLTPQRRFIQFPVGHAYLWHDPDRLTLAQRRLVLDFSFWSRRMRDDYRPS